MKLPWLAVALSAVLLSGVAARAGLAGGVAAAVSLVRVPHGGIQPEAVVDARGVLHLLYFFGSDARAGDLFYVRSTDEGTTFSAPVRVNSQEHSAIATGTIRGGQLAIGADGRVHVAWNGSDQATPRGLINPATGQPSAPFLYARSNAAGTAFDAQRNLPRRSYGIDGGGSIAADGRGGVYAAWHALAAGGGQGEDHRLVWIARSTDEGATFTEEHPVWAEATGACSCCGLRLLTLAPERLVLLYRSATAVTHRDIFILASNDAGRSFRGSEVQPWEIGACPMTSMAIAAAGSRVAGAWETAGQVYFGDVDVSAATVAAPIAAPGAADARKHPRLAIGTRGDTLFVWTEGTAWARGGALAWRVFDAAGRPTERSGRASGVPVWSFGAATARRDGGFTVLY
jgi:hypothetical protein